MMNMNILAGIGANGEDGKVDLNKALDAMPSSVWNIMAYLGAFLILWALASAGWGFIKSAGQGGRGGGGGENKKLVQMVAFGFALAGPRLWLPVAFDLLNFAFEMLKEIIAAVTGSGTP